MATEIIGLVSLLGGHSWLVLIGGVEELRHQRDDENLRCSMTSAAVRSRKMLCPPGGDDNFVFQPSGLLIL